MLATEAVKYQSETFIRLGTYFADLKNCVRILSMAINAGETIELVVSGVDELVAFERLSNVFDKINSNNC
jgi:phosphotransferase system HPr-like phosphotransfer protein